MEKIQLSLISIINELFQHPITTSVRSLPRDEKSTLDLEEIKNNVSSLKYSSVSQMCTDLERVWHELEERSENSQMSLKISCECRRLLGKLRSKYDNSVLPQWCNTVYKIRTNLTNEMTQPPDAVVQVIPAIGKARPTKLNATGMSERETYNFLLAADMIKKVEDHREMIKIVNEMQPELENASMEVNLNLNDLNAQTAQALKNYMRTALERDGLTYPE